MSAQNTAPSAGRIVVVEIIVTEPLDVAALPRMCALLEEALELRPTQLVIDVTDCPYADAAAIGLLLEVHRRTRRDGGLLTLRSPSARLRRNLRLARVDDVLHITSAKPRQPSPNGDGEGAEQPPPRHRPRRPGLAG